VTFANAPFVVTPISSDKAQILADIDAVVQAGGQTNVGECLKKARELFTDRGVPQILIVVTDAKANEPVGKEM